MIIGRDLFGIMGVNIIFKERYIYWVDDKIPLKTIGPGHDKDRFLMFYSMYIDSSLLQEAEEQQDKVMDCNYSKVDIDVMVADLDIINSNKE